LSKPAAYSNLSYSYPAVLCTAGYAAARTSALQAMLDNNNVRSPFGRNLFPAASAAARTNVIIIDDFKILLPIFYSFIIIGSRS
jgi:hypothetical protein